MASEIHTVKVLLIGDQSIGKTSLAKTMTEGVFPSVDTLPGRNDSCSVYKCSKEATIKAGDDKYILQIFDPDSENTLEDCLSQVDFCYLCFDVSNPATFDNVKCKWLPYLKQKLKCILVGLKSDLAHDACQQLELQGLRPITREAGQCLANEIKASQYVEVSALKYLGIEQVLKVQEKPGFYHNKLLHALACANCVTVE